MLLFGTQDMVLIIIWTLELWTPNLSLYLDFPFLEYYNNGSIFGSTANRQMQFSILSNTFYYFYYFNQSPIGLFNFIFTTVWVIQTKLWNNVLSVFGFCFANINGSITKNQNFIDLTLEKISFK